MYAHLEANRGEKCQGILISGQMGGWVGTDLRNNPLTNLISWQDQYSKNLNDKQESFFSTIQQTLDPEWFENTGRELRTTTHFLCCKKNQRRIKSK